MVEIVENEWRPFIKLKSKVNDDVIDVYLDMAKRPTILAGKDKTVILLPNEGPLEVLDSAEDIIKAGTEMVNENKRRQAEENEAAVLARTQQFAMQVATDSLDKKDK